MIRIYDRVMADPIAQCCIMLGIAFCFHRWWQGGEWGWLAAWCFMGAMSMQAIDDNRKAMEFEEQSEEGRPRLAVRCLGHPVVAWPVVLCCGFFAAAIVHDAHRHARLWHEVTLIILCFCLVPLALFLRWNLSRSAWRKRSRVVPAAKAKAPSPVPVATVVVPRVMLASPTVPEAIGMLPPALLELVREGVQAERGRG